jgi:predicted enzyme related to lactoylglutathione lyase
LRPAVGYDSVDMATLSRIAPEIPVADLKEAIRYYTQKLGFQLAVEAPKGDYAIIERDEVAIHLFEQSADMPACVGVHIFTHALEELHDELQGRGASICQGILLKPWGNREFRVNDCAGNTLKFTEPAITQQLWS